MEVLYPHCDGLDVHKDTVVACVRLMVNGRYGARCAASRRQPRSCSRCRTGWLARAVVAMEATGVYWKPVWHILSDGDFTLVLANAAHVKNVPGRKTVSRGRLPFRHARKVGPIPTIL
jgi:transposase